MHANDFVSIDEILAEVLTLTGDRNLDRGFSKGWYVSRIQRAVEELAIDTFFMEQTRDFDFPGKTFALEIPKDAFNIRSIFLFTGDCCKPSSSVPVEWKRGHNNRGFGKEYTSKRKEDGSSEPNAYYPTQEGYTNLYYANIQNGLLMFSSSGSSFEKVRITYNTFGGEIGEAPVIPRFCRSAVVDYVKTKYFEAKKADEPAKYRILWSDAFSEMQANWEKAENRIKSMDSFEKDTLDKYYRSIVHSQARKSFR